MVVEPPITGWFEKLERPREQTLLYQRTVRPLHFNLTLNETGQVELLSIQNITADGSLTPGQKMFYEPKDITVLCPDELGACDCRALEITGTLHYDGLYKMDEPDTNSVGGHPDVLTERPDPEAGKKEGHHAGGDGVQKELQRHPWPSWSLRERKRRVRSNLTALVLKIDLSLIPTLPRGKNTNSTAIYQIFGASPSSASTGLPHSRRYTSEGPPLLGDSPNSSSRPRKDFRVRRYVKSYQNPPALHGMHPRELVSNGKADESNSYTGNFDEKLKETTTPKPKGSQFQQSTIPLRRNFSHNKKCYKQALVGVAEKLSLPNTNKLTTKQSNSRNTDTPFRDSHSIFSKPSLEMKEIKNVSDNPSGHAREFYDEHNKEFGLRKLHQNQKRSLDQQPKTSRVLRQPSNSGSTPYTGHYSTEGSNDRAFPDMFNDPSQPVRTQTNAEEQPVFRRRSQVDTLLYTGDDPAYQERLEWDEELGTLVLVRGETLLAISDKSSPCPSNSSGSWWLLFNEPRAAGSSNIVRGAVSSGFQDPSVVHQSREERDYEDILEEPNDLHVSSQEEEYGNRFDSIKEQNSGAILERRNVTIACVHYTALAEKEAAEVLQAS